MRFDLRAPAFGAPVADLYAAALEMSAWGEEKGFTAVVVSEHHASDDGYLPSPLLLRRRSPPARRHVAISVAALLVPLYDPVKLAEDIAVLDNLSRGARLVCRRSRVPARGVLVPGAVSPTAPATWRRASP